jgi:hypothetical protein
MFNPKYSLIKLLSSIEKEADASNNIRVTYNTPNIDVIVGGVTEEEAYGALRIIDEEVEFYKGLFAELARIRKEAKNRKVMSSQVLAYEKSILTSKNEYINKLYLDDWRVWEQLEAQMKKLQGEYLIIPCFYKSI